VSISATGKEEKEAPCDESRTSSGQEHKPEIQLTETQHEHAIAIVRNKQLNSSGMKKQSPNQADASVAESKNRASRALSAKKNVKHESNVERDKSPHQCQPKNKEHLWSQMIDSLRITFDYALDFATNGVGDESFDVKAPFSNDGHCTKESNKRGIAFMTLDPEFFENVNASAFLEFVDDVATQDSLSASSEHETFLVPRYDPRFSWYQSFDTEDLATENTSIQGVDNVSLQSILLSGIESSIWDSYFTQVKRKGIVSDREVQEESSSSTDFTLSTKEGSQTLKGLASLLNATSALDGECHTEGESSTEHWVTPPEHEHDREEDPDMNTILSLNENIHFDDCTKSSHQEAGSPVQIGNSNGDIFSHFTAMNTDIPQSKVDNWTSLSKVFILREYLKSHGEGKGDRFVKQLFEPTLKANLIQADHFRLHYLALTPFKWIIPPQSFLDAHSGCSIESRKNRFASLLHVSLQKLLLKTLDSLDATHCPLKVIALNDKLQSTPYGNTVVEWEAQKQSIVISLIEKDGSELQLCNEVDRTVVVTLASSSKKSKKKKKKKVSLFISILWKNVAGLRACPLSKLI
jgi:hypothetical protein